MIANALLEYETLDGVQVHDIVKLGKFTPPPPPAKMRSTHRRSGGHVAS